MVLWVLLEPGNDEIKDVDDTRGKGTTKNMEKKTKNMEKNFAQEKCFRARKIFTFKSTSFISSLLWCCVICTMACHFIQFFLT